MGTNILLIKEEGSHPPIEGFLAPAAEVWVIRPAEGVTGSHGGSLGVPPKAQPDLVLCDLRLATHGAPEILGKLESSWHRMPAVLLYSSQSNPRELIQQLSELSRAHRGARRPSVKETARTLGVSQENLARMLHVSVRTAHRWLQGSRPRRKTELAQLIEIVSVLGQVLPDRAAIQQYLHRANPNLGNETPLEALLRGEFARVLADLEAAAEGVYV